jgi:phosphate:Na+ symporter
MRAAAGVAVRLAASAGPGHAADDDLAKKTAQTLADPGNDVVGDLERAAKALADLKAAHRQAALEMVASGKLTASQAVARVDAVALMSRLGHHAWRAVAHLERAAASRMEPEQ